MAKTPVTPAIRALRQAGIPFGEHLYSYEERGGAAHAARELAIDLHHTVKTIVLEDEAKSPLIALTHGDCEVAVGLLARAIGAKRVVPCAPETANKHTGYLVGGTSPFGTRKALPVYMEKSILDLPRAYINGGKRGFLVSLAPAAIQRVLKTQLVEASTALDISL